MNRYIIIFLSVSFLLLSSACLWNNEELITEQERVKNSVERMLKTSLVEGMSVDEVATVMKSRGIDFGYSIPSKYHMGGIILKSIAAETTIQVSITFHFSEKSGFQRFEVRLLHSFL